MINEKALKLSLLLSITEKLPYNKEEKKFYYSDKKYDESKISTKIYELVTEFMQEYEINDVEEVIKPSEAEESYVTDNAEKSE